MAEVFISYASEDLERARKFAEALEGFGWSVWWDRKITAGQPFDQVIERELESAKSVVVLWSKHSVASEWVKNEAAAADERGVVIPVFLDDVKLPLEFRRKQTVNLVGWGGDVSEAGFKALCDGVANFNPQRQKSHDAGYRDFDLRIWKDKEGNRYFAQVLDSPAGKSKTCHLSLPFQDLLQSDLQLRLENAVLRNVGHARGPATQGEKILSEFGQQIFSSIFRQAEGIGDLFKTSLNEVGLCADKPAGLRIKLRIEPPELARLPWEYLYDGSEDDWIALRRRSPIVRFLDIDEPVGDLTVNGPVNILGMIANPGGKKWGDLDVECERHNIDEALKPLVETGKIRFSWVPGETSRHLLSMMRKQIWHVFHFIGHGGVEAEEGFIVLRDEKGDPEEIKALDLKLMLGDGPLRLAVLNCCESGRGAISDPFASPAAALVRHGIPAVVAMQFPISDLAAIELARGFYESLADNLPLERAITEARLLVRRKSNIEWGIPVLYMHSRTGQLFSRIQPSPGASPALPPADPRPAASTSPGGARQRLIDLFK